MHGALRRLIVSLACGVLALPVAAKPEAPAVSDQVLRHLHVGGDGFWDYPTLDSATHRLYLAHGTRVDVVDVDSGQVVGQVAGTEGVHGVALALDLHRGFASNGSTSTVTVFDLKSLRTLTQVPTGEHPDAILYDSFSHRVFTFNARGRSTTAIDAATEKVVGTIPLDAKPEFAVSDGRGKIFVNLEDTGALAVLDPVHLRVLHRWPLAPCEEPTGLAIDRERKVLFSGCHNRLMAVTDGTTGKQLATLPIGEGVDGVAWDAARHLAFSSNGRSGTLTVVAEGADGSYAVVATVPTVVGARTVALDLKTHHLFLPTAKLGPPPAPTKQRPHPWPTIVPGTFEVLEVGP